MEHLLFNTHDAPLTVPYICQEDYDNGDFLSYPERKNWDISSWRWSTEDIGFDLNNRTIQAMSAFLQTWLYFGLLQFVLDVPIARDDFVRQDANGQAWITTSALPKYLEDWKVRYDKLEEVEQESHIDTIYEYLSEAKTINGMLNYLLFYGKPIDGAIILKQTLFAQMILTEALEGTSTRILQNRDMNPPPHYDTFLREYMVEAGWCISTVEYMQGKLPLQEQAYAFSLGSVRALQDHSACKEDVATGCMLGRVGENFRSLHAEEGCDCDFVSPPVEEVVQKLSEGLIPIITIVTAAGDPNSIELIVDGIQLDHREPYEAYPYFAVSHVWSDGLGNPHGNSLPRCQLIRMDSLARSLGKNTRVHAVTQDSELAAREHGTIAFWFDTLCIPVKPEHQHLRDFSIQKMQEIYLAAGGVMVLDPDLQQLSSTAPPTEVMSKVLISGWRSRLWTFQEGMLANELLIPGQGCCFTLSGEEDLKDDDGNTSIIERMLFRTLWWKCSYLIWNIITKHDIMRDPPDATRILLKAVAHRRTTRPGDETICIATFLGIDPTPLLNIAPEDRMPILMTLLPTIPAYILFTWGPRLNVVGFRWTPQTFLSPFGLQDVDEVSLPRTHVPNPENEPNTRVPIPAPYLHPKGLGLAVFFPALRINFSGLNMLSIPEVFSINTLGTDGNLSTYLIEARDTGTKIPWFDSTSPNADFVILLSKPVSGRVSVLVEILAENDDDDGSQIIGRWKGMVTVDKLDECIEDASIEKGEEFCLEGEYVPFRWWIVD